MYGLFWIYREIDGVGVGWQRRCKTCRPLRELDNHGTYPFLPYFFLFLAVAATGGQVISFVLGRESLLRTTRMIGSRRAYGNAPSMQLHCNPIAVPGSGHIDRKTNQVIRCCRSHARTFASKEVLSKMPLALHATSRSNTSHFAI